MWLFTEDGYYSIVEHWDRKTKPDVLVVRARDRIDLEIFVGKYLPAENKPEVRETLGRDYQYRVEISREAMAYAMLEAVKTIRYDNFKSRIVKSIGLARERIYHNVWSELTYINRKRPYSGAAPLVPLKTLEQAKPKKYDDTGHLFPKLFPTKKK